METATTAMTDTLDRKPIGPAEEKDERWVRNLPTYEPQTAWGVALKARLTPSTHTKVLIHAANPSINIHEAR